VENHSSFCIGFCYYKIFILTSTLQSTERVKIFLEKNFSWKSGTGAGVAPGGMFSHADQKSLQKSTFLILSWKVSDSLCDKKVFRSSDRSIHEQSYTLHSGDSMEKNNELGIYEIRKNESYLSILQSSSLLIVGIFFGYHLGRQGVDTSCSTPVLSGVKPFSESDAAYFRKDYLNNGKNIAIGAKLESFSELEYSCNSVGAFEQLTNLHKRAKDLNEHNKRGEANRSRQATVSRKANAARAAEQAFRKCVSTMMPELLNFWDDSLKKGEVNFRAWDEASEQKSNGITQEVLEKTADFINEELENTS